MSNNNEEYKYNFRLTKWALNNKATVYVVLFIIILFGTSSYNSMPRESFPELVIPRIFINTPYPGNSPIDVERLLTKPLEKEIGSISGIDKITSSSFQGFSNIDVEFNFSITPEEALRKVKDKVDQAMSTTDFPKDLPTDPIIQEMNMSEMMPIMNINLSGNFKLRDLDRYANLLEDELESLSEITEVDIVGLDEKEVEIELDLEKMEMSKISFTDIENAIKQENVTVSAGDILNNGRRSSVRILGEFRDMSQINKVIVKSKNQKVVYLEDIANVSFQEKDKESYSREYEKPVVTLNIKKKAGENLILVSEKIKTILSEVQNKYLPKSLNVSITNDTSNNTREQVSNLENSIIFGVLLVILVLMFFLGLRNSLFVGIAIPLSMFMSFITLNTMGITLNTMVLFSLVIALGMLVDNGIVVTENIYTLMSKGYSPLKASIEGVGEIAWPIIASTATTLAAFLPLAVWPGIMGEFMQYLPITLIIVLFSSLFVALFITPVIVCDFMSLVDKEPSIKKNIFKILILVSIGALLSIFGFKSENNFFKVIGNLAIIYGVFWFIYVKWLHRGIKYFQNVIMPKLEFKYQRMLELSIKGKNAYKTFFLSIFLLIFSFIILGVFSPKVLFFPEPPPDQIMIYVEFPNGTDIEETNKFTKILEDKVYTFLDEYKITEKTKQNNDTTYNYIVKSVIAQVGEGTYNSDDGFETGTPHKAKITVSFRESKYRRGVSTYDVMKGVRESIGEYPGVSVLVDKAKSGPPRQKPINIELRGGEYKNIFKTAKNLKSFIEEQKDVEGIENLKLSINIDKPEIVVNIDREKARMFNLSTSGIGMSIRTALYGKEVSRYKIDSDDDSYEINLRLKDDYRYDLNSLLNQKITFKDNKGKVIQIPASSVIDIENSNSFSSVKRKDKERLITLSSNLIEGYNANIIVAQLKEKIKNFHYDESKLNIKFTGEQEDQEEEMAFLSKALMIALFLIFLILVSQFNSISVPFIILSSVVLSLMGVFYGLVISRMDFIIIMSMIGIISLAGVVVNNAIVLIDYTNLLIDRKKLELNKEKLNREEYYECLITSGKSRLRPVLLTAITTVLGLVPLATGFNIDFFTLVTDYNPNIYIGGSNVAFWGPIAWTIIYGLSFATFLTLLVVPTMYYLLLRAKIRFSKK